MDFTEKRDLLTDVNPDALLADGFEVHLALDD
jgi:hypothetical protein